MLHWDKQGELTCQDNVIPDLAIPLLVTNVVHKQFCWAKKPLGLARTVTMWSDSSLTLHSFGCS